MASAWSIDLTPPVELGAFGELVGGQDPHELRVLDQALLKLFQQLSDRRHVAAPGCHADQPGAELRSGQTGDGAVIQDVVLIVGKVRRRQTVALRVRTRAPMV
jgi:hypothetical protein